MKNNIAELQNEPHNIKLLAAQRELYSSAKMFYAIQFLFSVLIPVVIAVVTLFNPQWGIYGAAYGIVFTVVEVIGFTPFIAKLKEKAASIQEEFDCTVLKLSRPLMSISDMFTLEDILKNHDQYQNGQGSTDDLKDWYGEEINNVKDQYIAALICQRSNSWWDLKLRKRYKVLIIVVLISIPVILLIAGLVNDIKLTEAVLMLGVLMPFFIFLQKELTDHLNVSKKLKQLNDCFQSTFEELEKKTLEKAQLAHISRTIQDKIFENRMNGSLVPDWVYKRFREKDETEMKMILKELISRMKAIEE